MSFREAAQGREKTLGAEHANTLDSKALLPEIQEAQPIILIHGLFSVLLMRCIHRQLPTQP